MGPFIKSKNKTSRIMRNLFISLIPIIIFSFYKNGILPCTKGYIGILEMFYPLIFILIGMLSSLLVEEIYLFVFSKKRGQDLIDAVINGYSYFPGLFLSLILPINTPLSVLFIGTIFAIIIGKMVFGGFGNNIFNPALIGCIFIMVSFGTAISANGGYLNKLELDTISSATPLTNVSIIDNIGSYDTLVKPYGSLLDFFVGTIPGSVGETSALICLISFIFLALTKTIKWRIPVTYISTVFIMTFIIGAFNGVGIWYPLFEILSGGLFFGAIFMATDPVTSPVNKESQIIYGILLGFITVLLRYLTSYPEGVMTSILLMNALVYFLDKKTSKLRFNIKKYYIILAIILIVTLGASYLISTTFVAETESDINYHIISKKKEDNKTIYQVTEKGFGGNIKAEIVFNTREIISIDILENSESKERYELIVNEDYINTLINKQTELDSVDAVSSATITSNALKKMIINTVNDFKTNTDEIDNTEDDKETGVTIKDTVTDGDISTYTVDVESFGGIMEARVVMKGQEIKTLIPVTFNDTCVEESKKSAYYECPSYMTNGYIDTLIKNQNSLDTVDTVSGATISSTALKKIVTTMKEGS